MVHILSAEESLGQAQEPMFLYENPGEYERNVLGIPRKAHKRMTQNSKKNNDNTVFSTKHHLKQQLLSYPKSPKPSHGEKRKRTGYSKRSTTLKRPSTCIIRFSFCFSQWLWPVLVLVYLVKRIKLRCVSAIIDLILKQPVEETRV